VQYRPTTAELLQSIGDLLNGEVLRSAPLALQHQVRVAGNLVGILGPAAEGRERKRLAALVGHDGEVTDLSAELAGRLRTGDDPEFEHQAWQVLVDIARDDLAIAKPGHDSWEGE